jgi:hypothetical protein
MTGILAQLVTLTGYGNAFLADNSLPIDFYSENKSFVSCNRVNFNQYKKTFFLFKPSWRIIATNPVEWFNYLKGCGCIKLRLFLSIRKRMEWQEITKWQEWSAEVELG